MTNLGSGMINGFSLLDLMLTLVIASLLAALAVPAYNGFLDKGRNAKASRDDIVRANNGDFIGRGEDY